MRFKVRQPNVQKIMRQAAQQQSRDLKRAALIATDKAAVEAQRALQNKIRAVGLGRLAGAVGKKSRLRGGAPGAGDLPYGVIFARGGDESLAGGALESYSQGSTIRARNAEWLAFQTAAIPRRIGRFRTTPARYQTSGLATSIGQLEFRPINSNLALYVIKRVTLSPKTGRARRAGKRPSKTRINQKEIVAFVLIKVTRRAKRFDKDDTVRQVVVARMPDLMIEALATIHSRRT